MPSYPAPVGRNGGLPPIWNAVFQTMQALNSRVAGAIQGAVQGNIVDQYGNAVEIAGSNLAQTVTIGASFGQAGVLVGTGVTGAGRAVQQNLATTTITLTKGSVSATVASGAGLSHPMVIGAADVSDPTSGLATPAITPGTTIGSITGTAVTLSAPAAESGTGLFCAACVFTPISTF